MRRSNLFLTVTITLAVVFGIFFARPVFAQPSDIAGHWAEKQISEWVDKGLAKGYPDGTYKPDTTITRAEFITLVNKVFGFNNSSEVGFSDVKSTDWFYGEIAKGKAAGYISGYEDGTIKPNNRISRQEAAAMLAKALNINTSGDFEVINRFLDAGNIPQWSKGAIADIVEKGFMSGYPDQTFKPERPITRAEAISTLDRAANAEQEDTAKQTITYDKAGSYGPESGEETIDGNVVVAVPDVTLQNLVINGDLVIAEGVGDGDVHLKNVTVKGNTLINAAGQTVSYWKTAPYRA